MSLTSALSTAVSGLRATSVAADVVGTNISNAMNENYARRDVVLEQFSNAGTGGVRVTGISRAVNEFANVDWRAANAQAGGLQTSLDAATRITQAYGLPTESNSLQAKMADFEAALASAGARPDLPQRLDSAVYAMQEVTSKMNEIGNGIQTERMRADERIASTVGQINSILEDLENVNGQIAAVSQQGKSIPQMFDRQEQLLDQLSEFVDFRVFPRDMNTVAVYTSDGVGLLDGAARSIGFERSGLIDANSRVEDGDLNTLTVNGTPVSAGRMSSGVLGALFELRDVSTIESQQELDALAFDFAKRVNDASLDPTRTAVDAGFLTDTGLAIDATMISGLSQRISVNSAVNPSAGGDPSLLRDGLFASTSGPAGNATLINGIAQSLSGLGVVSEGQFTGMSLSASDYASEVGSVLSLQMARTEDLLVSAQAKRATLDELRQANGVDTDNELQKLLLIEQSYGANARVIQTIDELMDTLLGAV